MDLRKFRIEHNLTQAEFAKIIGIPRQTYQTYEYDTRKPKIKNIRLIEIAIDRIENERKNIEKIYDRMQAIKSYEKIQKYYDTYPQQIDDDFPEKDKFNIRIIKILSFILLILILTVLW